MKRTEVKNGVKVILLPGHYPDSPANPLWGGKHGKLIGIIDAPGAETGYVGVMWENGLHNGYDCSQLTLYDAPEGICDDIW